MTEREIDHERIAELLKRARKLGYDVKHVHADNIKLPGRVRIKIELWQKDKKR